MRAKEDFKDDALNDETKTELSTVCERMERDVSSELEESYLFGLL